MTIWDWLAIGVTSALVVEGLLKGAVRLAFGLGGLILGYAYAGRMAPSFVPLLSFIPEKPALLLAVALGFSLILLMFVAAGALIERLVKSAGLHMPNRVLGAILGLVVSAYLAGGLCRYAEGYSKAFRTRLEGSPVVSALARGAVFIEGLLPISHGEVSAPETGRRDLVMSRAGL